LRSLLLAAVLFAAAVDCQASQELVTVPTRRSVTETYLLIRNAEETRRSPAPATLSRRMDSLATMRRWLR